MEQKEEKDDKIGLIPAEPPPFKLTERDAKNLIYELMEICTIAVSTSNLPSTRRYNQSWSYHLEEIMNTLKEYNLIE